MPVPLHNHTHASALDGLAKPWEIAERCKELGFGSVACTDHDIVAGHFDFYTTIRDAELKPILGIETYQTIDSRFTNKGFRTDPKTKEKADNFHLILLAMNQQGLRNLYALNSEAHATGFYYNGRTDWDILEKYNEGLIATSACGLGLLSQAVRGNSYAGDEQKVLNKYLSIFRDRFYVEVSTYTEIWQQDLNEQLVSLARGYGVPIVYANDAHYAFPGQYKLHEMILCMQYQEKASQRTEPHHVPDLYIMDEDEINHSLMSLPQDVVDEAIDNSEEIADLCNVTMEGYRKRVPVFIPESKWSTAKAMLFDLAVEGYKRLVVDKGLPDEVYMPRFKMEIEALYAADLVDYLLIVRDYVQYAQDKGYLIGPGRGSVGGSLVAYCLGIHQLDPIKYGLLFERFYNKGRVGKMPDIDTDFPTFGRDDVKAFIAKKYGAPYVADIGTTTTLQGRAAIQKLSSAMEIPFTDSKAISAIIGDAIESGQQPTWKEIKERKKYELAPYINKHPLLFEYAEALERHISNYGTHASGIMIGDEPIREVFPLRWHAKDKKLVTQWDMRTAEKLGFLKMDILGLRNLDGLMEFLKIIGKAPDFFYDLIDVEGNLPEEMWELFDEGLTVGLFQIEDVALVKSLCKQIRPRNLEDIALITAMNRPGPLKSGSHLRYIKCRNGEPVNYRHPIFEKVADDTYGEIIYQEQFIAFFEELGYDKVQADIIRDIVGKKKRVEMAKIEGDFKERFLAHPGSDYPRKWNHLNDDGELYNRMMETLADLLWKELENFADYAFNKAHSVGYGLITLWTAYAKYYNPTAFYIGAMKSLVAEGKKDETYRYIRETPRFFIDVLKPDINQSQVHTSLEGKAIRYGLADVKGIGLSPAKWIVQNRPFKDFDDLAEKAQDPDRKITLKNGTRMVALKKNQIEVLKSLYEAPEEEMADVEEELLGIALSDLGSKILAEYQDEIDQQCTPIEDTDAPGNYTVAGVITAIKESKTKQGMRMARVTIENAGKMKEIAVWNTELERLKFIWRRRQAVLLYIKVTDRGASIVNAKALYSKKT